MLYKLNNNKLEIMKFDDFRAKGWSEKDLENLLAENLMNIVFEDNQLMPVFQERQWQKEADLWALDQYGNMVIFELKVGVVGKDTTLQILRYAQTHGMKTYSELEKNYQTYMGDSDVSLKEAHKENFQLENALKETDFNRNQKLIIVGSSSDIELMRAVDYWKGKGLDIDFIPYRIYDIGKDTYFEFFAKPYDYHLNPKDVKGIIFDTCGTYNEGYTKEMYEDKQVRAWGAAADAVGYFNRNDYVFYYVKGKGIVAAGRILWDKPKEEYKGATRVKYHNVDMVVPINMPESIDDLRCISAGELGRLLGGKSFYWARTTKVPYLTEEESKNVIIALKKLYNE
ncbi:MAG: hypothetical protein IJV92_00265 [Phascolarctobacterium sp.]|nr:hypothetical protein [Phascolarctobacterium sp.]